MNNEDILYVWFCLEQAKNNRHPYGGDTAEIFAQHCISKDSSDNQWKQAGKNLYTVINQFCNIHKLSASVNGKEIGNWMNDYNFFHKCDVRIINDQRTTTGMGSSSKVYKNPRKHNKKNPKGNNSNKGS